MAPNSLDQVHCARLNDPRGVRGARHAAVGPSAVTAQRAAQGPETLARSLPPSPPPAAASFCPTHCAAFRRAAACRVCPALASPARCLPHRRMSPPAPVSTGAPPRCAAVCTVFGDGAVEMSPCSPVAQAAALWRYRRGPPPLAGCARTRSSGAPLRSWSSHAAPGPPGGREPECAGERALCRPQARSRPEAASAAPDRSHKRDAGRRLLSRLAVPSSAAASVFPALISLPVSLPPGPTPGRPVILFVGLFFYSKKRNS